MQGQEGFPGDLDTLVREGRDLADVGAAMLRGKLPEPSSYDTPQTFPAMQPLRARVCLLTGCVQTVLNTRINETTVQLLQRHGVEVVIAKGADCCGAPAEHMGLKEQAEPFVKANIAAWLREDTRSPIDAIVINASGCGTSVKAYGHALRMDDEWGHQAAKVSGLAKDITEYVAELGLRKPVNRSGLRVIYHSACSMQHGQRITRQPVELLRSAGFEVVEVPESYMCCGSAGVYNLLQPNLPQSLKRRKIAQIQKLTADVIASGNIGCMTQLEGELELPFVHTVELLDWATGGPTPKPLRGRLLQ
ncbi:heterodisulfide reductase-related iron-sulfur binding cluster [Dyella sp. Tek66A03]|uniref:heterodisulfide reductase-related iron-sulfur binding cluster n=1 Tax=Dyella sp. Tek66A03 TaxID=3458298 RepID=UPI00403EE7FA